MNGTVPTSVTAKAVFNQEFKLIEQQAISNSKDDFVNILSSVKSEDFTYSDLTTTIDTSLMTVEKDQEKVKTDTKEFLKNNAETVKSAVSLTEPDLWKRIGEIERERKAMQKK